jgi:hypothetical protein
MGGHVYKVHWGVVSAFKILTRKLQDKMLVEESSYEEEVVSL